MKHTEQQIFEISIKILRDLNPKKFAESDIENIIFSPKDKTANSDRKLSDSWLISIKSLFGNIDILAIADETGEPLYYQNFNFAKVKIQKDSKGIYTFV